MFQRSISAVQFLLGNAAAHHVKNSALPGKIGTKAARASMPLAHALRRLAIFEFLTVLGCALLSKILYLDVFLQSDASWLVYASVACGLAATLHITYEKTGLYDIERLAAPDVNFGKIISGLIVSLLIVLGILYAVKQSVVVSRGWILVWLVTMAVSIALVRAQSMRLIRRGIAKGRLQHRIAIIGTRDHAMEVAALIRQTEGLSSAVEAYGLQSETGDGFFVGGMSDLERAILADHYDRVIVAIPSSDVNRIRSVVKSLGSYTTELLLCTDLKTLAVGIAGARQIGGLRADVVHLLPESENSWLVKRLLDVLIASVSLVLLLPVFVLVALAIKFDTQGPVFFKQRRLGRNSTIFAIYKFRSMTVAEDGAEVVQAIKNDRRVTRVGRVLRAMSIDELPQFINVLLGQMSVVGPRPHAIAHDQAFEQQFDLFSRRRRVKPGITGWAQVKGFRGETKTPDDVRRRMEHDLFYIDHWSIWLDIEIIARTMFVFAKGAY